MLTEEGVFSIVAAYLRLAAQGGNICAFRADEYYWRDLGKLESIEQVSRERLMHATDLRQAQSSRSR